MRPTLLLTFLWNISFSTAFLLPLPSALGRPATTTTTTVFESIFLDPEGKVALRDPVPPMRPRWDMSGDEIDYSGKKDGEMNGMYLSKKSSTQQDERQQTNKQRNNNTPRAFSLPNPPAAIDVSFSPAPSPVVRKSRSNIQQSCSTSIWGTEISARRVILAAHAAGIVYQLGTTTASLWKRSSLTSAVLISLAGTASMANQPLVKDWALAGSSALARKQPHRYFTGALLDGNAFSFLMQYQAFKKLPHHLESFVGTAAFSTTFVCSVLMGSLTHSMWGSGVALGMTGGLAGLYGLWTATLCWNLDKQTNFQNVVKPIASGMGQLFLMALAMPRTSAWSQLGGFVTGSVLGSVFVHQTQNAPPSRVQYIVKGLWIAMGVIMLVSPTWRQAPSLVLQSLLSPGSLTRRFGV